MCFFDGFRGDAESRGPADDDFFLSAVGFLLSARVCFTGMENEE